MKRKSIVVALSLFAMLAFAGQAWTWNVSDHVTIAPNNQGDLMTFPMYAAIEGGFETKFTVVNTSDDASTVAKFVVRSELFSEELLDFMIYLSPKDMWTGYLRYDAQKGPVVYSEDDSVLWAPGEFASEDNPFEEAILSTECDNDTNQIGYVTVLNVASSSETIVYDGENVDLGNRPVAKSAIKSWFDTYTTGDDLNEEDLPQNILAGWMDFNIKDLNLTSSIRPVTYKDYGNLVKQDIRAETVLGDDARNSRGELEASLVKTSIGMPYINSNTDFNLHWFTFPTKYTQTEDCSAVDAAGPFFKDLSKLSVVVGTSIYDTQENKDTPPGRIVSPPPETDDQSFSAEVNFISSTIAPDDFEKGWIEYTFNQTTSGVATADGMDFLTYKGAPVIPLNMRLFANGLSMSGATWSNGDVSTTIDGVETLLEDYQVTDNF